ncbi:MAG: hypothetical protein ACI932_002708 [Paracoccaceae bacterium]|jgi:hypothetical protein
MSLKRREPIHFPFDTVKIDCPTCGRSGSYSKERFCEIVGTNTQLPQALGIIAKDCSKKRPSISNMHGDCRPGYPQLVALTDKDFN